MFLFAVFVPAYTGGLSFSNTSWSTSSINTDFTVTRPDMNSGNVYVFSVCTKEQTAVSGVSVSLEKSCPLTASVEASYSGWYSGDYLQWFKLEIEDKKGIAVEHIKGKISIDFDESIFREGAAVTESTVKNNIFHIPLAGRLRKSQQASLLELNYRKAVKIEIASDGIYSISGHVLAKLGVPLDNVKTLSYRLFCKNIEQPIYITNSHHSTLHEDDKIMFYAKRLYGGPSNNYTSYSYTNTYWLSWEGGHTGLRVADILVSEGRKENLYVDITEIPQASKASFFRDTARIENDNEIYWFGTVNDFDPPEEYLPSEQVIDNWYWGKIGEKKLTQFNFDLCSPSYKRDAKTRISIALTGFTFLESEPLDHSLQVLINGEDPTNDGIWKLQWDGQKDTVFSSGFISTSLLKHGKNEISFIVDDRPFHDVSALNWIEIEYDKEYQALGNTIQFALPDENLGKKTEFTLSGFTRKDIEIWDIENFRRFRGYQSLKEKSENREDDSTQYSVVFSDSLNSRAEYLAVTDSLVKSPYSLSLDTIKESNFWKPPEDIDYIIVTVDSFTQILDTLSKVHESRGFNVKTISINDIYNSFSYGIKNPEAIRSMLTFIYDAQESPPEYLLLCGDASHDLYKGYFKFRTIVPTHLSRVPGWGPASNDGYFASFKGSDYFPEMSVGRLPAQNIKQLEIMVDKTIRYLTKPLRGYWKDNILLAGGSEIDFFLHSNVLENDIIDNRMTVFRMDANKSSPYHFSAATASNTMADYINSGIYALSFAGHGGGLIWSDSKFFSYSDLENLHNSQWGGGGKLPIIFSFTCLTGFFESVHYISLGEEFLRKSSDGAIAFYSASGYSRRDMDLNMNRVLLETAMKEEVETVGELISMTEMLSIVKYGKEAIPNVYQYNLLGDPSIPWSLTPDTMDIELEDISLKGSDTVKIKAVTSPVRDGSAKIKIEDGNVVWKETIQPVSDSEIEYRFPLKEYSSTSKGKVRIYSWNDSSEIVGWRNFAKDTSMIYNVEIFPSSPAVGDSVEVRCHISFDDTSENDGFICLYSIDYEYQKDSDFETNNPVFMEFDSSAGLWKSSSKLFISNEETAYDINKMLLVKFRIPGEIGETKIYSFPVKGRADLAFSDSSISLSWKDNSLKIVSRIINSGSLSADSFNVTYYWDTTDSADILFDTVIHGGISPSEIRTVSFSLPDTQGVINLTSHINRNRDIAEISYENNSIKGADSLWYKKIKYPSDTLFSPGGGFAVCPSDTLVKRTRVYLFKRTHEGSKPVSTSSSWVQLKGDGVSYFSLYSKPGLTSGSDSLNIIFYPLSPSSLTLNKKSDTLSNPVKIMMYDSMSTEWFTVSSGPGNSNDWFLYKTEDAGTFGLASIYDNTPPEIRAFVDGREILFLDFAARGKPFNIFIDDASGVYPSSVRLMQNSIPVDSSDYSTVLTGDDPKTVSLTASLRKYQKVDTLTVTASDYAGNRAEKSFAYMPGEKLKINFLSCHPNPFSAEKIPGTERRKNVRFAFLLTDAARKVKLEIFTISSKKVWKWKNSSDLIGYQEVVWDGLSSKGYRIANGMYYAKLTAENDSRKVTKIIKIAKLEGY